jgi:hypothetical protein
VQCPIGNLLESAFLFSFKLRNNLRHLDLWSAVLQSVILLTLSPPAAEDGGGVEPHLTGTAQRSSLCRLIR